MRNPFAPNGIKSTKIIYRLAQKEFGNAIKASSSFLSIKKDITNVLKQLKSDELEEHRLDVLVGMEHLVQNDFGNFISVRFAYWGLILAILVIIIGDVPIYDYFNMSKLCFGNVVMILLLILLITMARTIHMQHDQMEYLNFKLICINELLEERKCNLSNSRKKSE